MSEVQPSTKSPTKELLSCSSCPKTFQYKKSLKKHQKSCFAVSKTVRAKGNISANEEAKDYSAIPDGDQTAFIEHEVNDGSAIINHESSIASDRSLQQNEHVMERASSTENLNMIGGNMM